MSRGNVSGPPKHNPSDSRDADGTALPDGPAEPTTTAAPDRRPPVGLRPPPPAGPRLPPPPPPSGTAPAVGISTRAAATLPAAAVAGGRSTKDFLFELDAP